MPIKKYKTKKQARKGYYNSISKCHNKTTRCINVRFHLVNDKEVLDQIDKQPNKAEYLRNLILADINKNK